MGDMLDLQDLIRFRDEYARCSPAYSPLEMRYASTYKLEVDTREGEERRGKGRGAEAQDKDSWQCEVTAAEECLKAADMFAVGCIW